MLPNNLFFTQIINQSVMHSPPLFKTASQLSGRFLISCLKKSAGLAMNKSSQFWSSSVIEGNCVQIVGESGKCGESDGARSGE
jgi:hypothetical protein